MLKNFQIFGTQKISFSSVKGVYPMIKYSIGVHAGLPDDKIQHRGSCWFTR